MEPTDPNDQWHFGNGLLGPRPESNAPWTTRKHLTAQPGSQGFANATGLLSAPSNGLLGGYGANMLKAWNQLRQPANPMPDPRPWIYGVPDYQPVMDELKKRQAAVKPDAQIAADHSPLDAALIAGGYGLNNVWGYLNRGLTGAGMMGAAAAGAPELTDVLAMRLAEARKAKFENDLAYAKLERAFPDATALGEYTAYSLLAPDIRRK